MQEGKRRLQRAVKGALDKKTDKPIEFKGMMGAYVAGVQTLVVAARPDFVYVRIRGATGEVVQAFNDNVAEVWDLPVMVARDPKFKHIWRITGRDIANYPDWGGASYLPPHGDTHTFVGAEGYGSDPSWIAKRQFLPFLPMPNPSGTNTILVEQDYWYWEGRFRYWPGSGTADLLTFRPTGGGHGRFVTVYMRGDEGILDYLVGPEFSLLNPPTDPTDFIPVPDPDVGIPICAVSLQTGTTNIGWQEIYDLRLAASSYPTTGSLIHIYDEGVSVGMVSALDFHGAGVEAVVSGSFGYILHTGTPGPPSGIVVLDEGIVLGTGIYVDFVGDNIEATISGTHVRIFITGAAGGVIAWDDGVPQCVGTIIDFGDNLDVSCSGTVIRVDATGGGGGTGTYVRAGEAIPLATITGGYWRIPEGEYMTGTLSVGLNGVWQTPVTDFAEQWPPSGTFNFEAGIPTGSIVSVIWGAPDLSGGGGGSGDDYILDIYDDSVLVCDEIEAISFDENLDVSCTGSFAYVNAVWPTVEAWSDVATGVGFENNWVNFGGGWASAAYYKDPFDVVHIIGLIKDGTLAATVFTLPAGYRPAAKHSYTTKSAAANSNVDVNVDGTVVAQGTNNGWFGLFGVDFRV